MFRRKNIATLQTWPIDNAIAKLEEMKNRMDGYPVDPEREEVRKAINNAMEYSIAVVRGINEITPPQPPSIKIVFRNAIGEFIADIARALETFGVKLGEVNEWGWKRDPYD